MAKPVVLQLGAPIRYNHEQYARFRETFDVAVNTRLSRDAFKEALRAREYGDFYAVYRPFWNDGAQMGQWDRELIDLLPSSCKIIAMAGAGFDWIDIPYLSARGIVYCNGGWGPTEAVGDNALWHIISTFRNFGWSFKHALTGQPGDFLEAHTNCVLTAYNPQGHTLGVIGMGKIGYCIAQKAAHGLGMKIAYHDLIQRPKKDEATLGGARYYKNLDDMLAVSDCVVLATPAFKDKFMDRATFAKFKQGSRFVNIARGKLVDDDALVDALESGHIYAAGLDVFYTEPTVPEKYRNLKTVTLTCHNGGGSVSTWEFFEKLGMVNILQFYQTGKAVSPVNLQLVAKSKAKL